MDQTRPGRDLTSQSQVVPRRTAQSIEPILKSKNHRKKTPLKGYRQRSGEKAIRRERHKQ
jgi:hypothetical protein